jgi:sugar (pentulose or hexulose) kinase
MIADVFLKKVRVTNGADASAIGAAMLGWENLGVFAGPEEAAALVRAQAVYEPDENRHAVYESNYGVFIQLYSRLRDLM